MYQGLGTQLTLTLRVFLCQDMTQMTLLSFETAAASAFETLGRATVCLHFWHVELPFINFNLMPG